MLYLREQECEYPWLFSEVKRGPRVTTFGEQCHNVSPIHHFF